MNRDKLRKEFETLYGSESDAIFRFCLIRVSDREQALDITQETFTRLWRTLLEGKEMTNARSFLFTVAHRLIIDWYRKKKAVSLESLSSSSADGEENYDYEPVEESAKIDLELETEGRYLLSAISRLRFSYRQPIYLKYVEGLSPPDIGKIMGISANAVSVRINRGLEDLRRLTGYSIEDQEK